MQSLSFTPQRPKNGLIGHRGLAALAPENTLASFTAAALHGLDWIEFDVQLTKDNDLVIFHDDTLDRTTNGHGLLYEHTVTELLTLDAGSWFRADYKGEAIPIFSEILPTLLALPLTLNIELKLPTSHTPLHTKMLTERFCEVLAAWPKSTPLPLVSSFYWPILEHVKATFPLLPVGYLCEQCAPQIIEKISTVTNAACHTDFHNLNPEIIALAKKYNVPLLAYTVNQVEIAQQLLENGLFAVFSDFPLFNSTI